MTKPEYMNSADSGQSASNAGLGIDGENRDDKSLAFDQLDPHLMALKSLCKTLGYEFIFGIGNSSGIYCGYVGDEKVIAPPPANKWRDFFCPKRRSGLLGQISKCIALVVNYLGSTIGFVKSLYGRALIVFYARYHRHRRIRVVSSDDSPLPNVKFSGQAAGSSPRSSAGTQGYASGDEK